jgi:hypothetical protein
MTYIQHVRSTVKQQQQKTNKKQTNKKKQLELEKSRKKA